MAATSGRSVICCFEMIGAPAPVRLYATRAVINTAASMTTDAAAIHAPRNSNDIRRRCSYSWKQGEQLTMCDTGRSSSVRRRSRFAIAFKLEGAGHPSRFGFGNAVLEYFLPRATIFLIRLDDADRLNSLIRIHSMQVCFYRATAVSNASCDRPGIVPGPYPSFYGIALRRCEHRHNP